MATATNKAGLRFVRFFDEIGIADVPLVGGKNAPLGEMCRELGAEGVNLADGFAVTADAYREFLEEAGLVAEIQATFADLDTQDASNLHERGRRVRQMILAAELPEDLKREIIVAYKRLTLSILELEKNDAASQSTVSFE
jgi:pyruvate, water dikinase